MKNSKRRSYFLLLITLLFFLSLPIAISEKFRGGVISLFSSYFLMLSKVTQEDPKDLEIKRLLIDNHQLGEEILKLKELMEQEYFLVRKMLDDELLKGVSKESVERREKEILSLFQLQLESMPAHVIYRPINAWNSSLWVNRGEADNIEWGRRVIEKNSPVVLGKGVVGVVEYVGKNESRIRLITDPLLPLSIRVKRGNILLAKGELKGAFLQHFRKPIELLKGIGFNYDFGDMEGPARDLRTGAPFDPKSKLPAVPLVLVGDLLVTTGMDGIFPRGLEVGVVKKIDPLKEGDIGFQIYAEPTVKNLSGLSVLFILPPVRI